MVTSAAWDVLRDVGALQTVTLHVRGTPSVDITTGVITQTDTAVTITDALVQRYSTREVDGIRITAGDRRLQFLSYSHHKGRQTMLETYLNLTFQRSSNLQKSQTGLPF